MERDLEAQQTSQFNQVSRSTMHAFSQQDLFAPPSSPGPATEPDSKEAQSGTFTPNMKLPVHRWFRYSAGFSADWVSSVIASERPSTVLDPFVGSGTVCIEADKAGVASYGVEAHPFVNRLAYGKLSWFENIEKFKHVIDEVENRALRSKRGLPSEIPSLLEKCYEPEALEALYKIRDASQDLAHELSTNLRSLLFLAVNAILRPCSHVGTAQWQYVLPNKRKATVIQPIEALRRQAMTMVHDMSCMQSTRNSSHAKLIQSDARTLNGIPDDSIDLVVTSPPYPNNYDYADATRLEMTFWGEVNSWGDLHDTVRKHLICSCAQHSSKDRLDLEKLLERPSVEPIRRELAKVCGELASIRETKAGNKSYHTMIAAYFSDMGETFKALRRVTRKGGTVCMVIGDSAPYGVHAPAEQWFEKQALFSGFTNCKFEKIRERNVKWKNRKHTVPLHEGRLWIKG